MARKTWGRSQWRNKMICEHCKRAIEAAIVPQWQPIESAPKDELILVGPTKRMGICVAMHHSRDGWVTETTSEWVTMYTPTHWMPLPAAPKASHDPR